VNALTDEELEAKTEVLIEEYFASSDTAEAITCIRELNSPRYAPDIVNKALSMSLERNERDREAITKLFSELYKDGVFLSEHFEKGYACHTCQCI
jgi:hypothetical protein